MEKLIQKYIYLINQVNMLNDTGKLMFLKTHSDKFKVQLDNDCTAIILIDRDIQDYIEENKNITINCFDNYHGWTDPIVELFEFAGIKAEVC